MARMAWLCLAAFSVVGTAGAADTEVTAENASDEGVAVVTIDLLTPDVVRGQCPDGSCNECSSGSCNDCDTGSCGCGKSKCGRCSRNGGCKACNGCNECEGGFASRLKSRLKDKFGYFCPTGNCGRGMPLWGKYHMVYAAQPGYTDARDGYSFAAPGYGTPVNVPLAPNVRHTYNYGWGIPSSRLTPLRQAQVVGPAEPIVHHAPIWRY